MLYLWLQGNNKSCDSLKLVSNTKDKIDLKRSDK